MYCQPPRDNEGSEPDADPFAECHSLRLRLTESFDANEWPDVLERYGEMVDCRDRVDNFSAATLALVSGQETDRSQWHTALSEPPPERWLADLGIRPCTAEQFTGARIRVMIPKTTPPENVTRDTVPAEKARNFSSRTGFETDVGANRPKPFEKSSGFPSERQEPLNQSRSFSSERRTPFDQSRGFSSERRESSNQSRSFPSDRQEPFNQTRGFPSESERQTPQRNPGRGAAGCRDDAEAEAAEPKSMFLTASDELRKQRQLRGVSTAAEPSRKCLGPRRKAGFVPPFVKDVATGNQDDRRAKRSRSTEEPSDEPVDERLAHVDPKMVELIRGEIMDECRGKITWDDVAGLEYAKATIQEMVVWPLLRPDLFTGLRSPPRGLLLFGPPGTGKTLLGRCIAAHAQATFFSVSAATLTSKWVGDGEKMVRALFAVARCHQPAVVFIDEIDSMLTQRSDTEHESSRRLKTEFLVQLDGAGVSGAERVLVVGATNRPQELDEAARRRLVKRLYIPLPDQPARRQLVARLLSGEKHSLTDADLDSISTQTHGFSGADLRAACAEAALGPVRQLGADMRLASAEQVRPVSLDDFKVALTRVKPSVAPGDLDAYLAWDKTFGCGS